MKFIGCDTFNEKKENEFLIFLFLKHEKKKKEKVFFRFYASSVF